MTNEKIYTKAELYRMVIAMVNGEEIPENAKAPLIERMNKDIESTFRKSNSTNTKKNEATNAIVELIQTVLEAEPTRLFNATEITKALNFEYSVQKITSVLNREMVPTIAEKLIDKKKVYYRLAKSQEEI